MSEFDRVTIPTKLDKLILDMTNLIYVISLIEGCYIDSPYEYFYESKAVEKYWINKFKTNKQKIQYKTAKNNFHSKNLLYDYTTSEFVIPHTLFTTKTGFSMASNSNVWRASRFVSSSLEFTKLTSAEAKKRNVCIYKWR